ncbi:zinc finger MYM-type protein 1-like [Phyllobates terribilis]|uniref:zinc finger MYM-type protein 1-like n=1 Tax=Phyllobates terribilis TaxID=111132 RepID=UPI003CCAFC34
MTESVLKSSGFVPHNAKMLNSEHGLLPEICFNVRNSRERKKENSPVPKFGSTLFSMGFRFEIGESSVRFNGVRVISLIEFPTIQEQEQKPGDGAVFATKKIQGEEDDPKRNLAFRGSSDRLFTPNNGNFLGFVQVLGKFDRVMSEHLHRVVSKEISDHYCGKTIQNEIIALMASQVINHIVTRCNQAKYYSIILDCTPDLSHKEQMSFTIRFLDEVCGIYTIKEHFIGYKNVVDTTGKGLTDALLDFLSEKNLDITNCRGQGYDNGANMAGKHNGVQVQILEKNSRAVFVPCGCHCLNLVVGDAARSSKDSKDLFGLIQCIYVLFSGSVKRWKILTDHISGLTLKPMSTTRWECRIDCLKPFRYHLGDIHEALIALSEEERVEPNVSFEAKTLAQKITDFKFIMSFIIWYDILFQINIVSKAMQRQTSDLSTVTELIHKCLEFIRNFREKGFDMALQSAKEIAENLNLEPVFRPEKRIRVKKASFSYEGRDEAITDPQSKFKVDFFFVLVDTASASLEERFKQLENHNGVWGFLYNIKNNSFSREDLTRSCLNLQAALVSGTESDVNGEELAQEFYHIQSLLPSDTINPLDVLNFINKNSLTDTFPNLWVALRILLTIPVTVASGERSFSKLKLIKTYLRSSMSDDRLTALAVLSIENDILQSLDMTTTIDEFARTKARKVIF